MLDPAEIFNPQIIKKITPGFKNFLNNIKNLLTGAKRRKFMANIAQLLEPGGQRRAERELGWNRKTIIKGNKEIITGIDHIDHFSKRGRKKAEEHIPNLLKDIKEIVVPESQTDPTFRTDQLYCPLSAGEVRRRLIEEKGYVGDKTPTERTIRNKMNKLNFKPQKVAKTKPKKKIPETDDIFDNVHELNKIADDSSGVIRISFDAKATIKIGPFSRGGYNRQGLQACDHDFAPDALLGLFGIFLPAYDESFFYFTESKITADFIVDAVERLWPELKRRFSPHTLVINSDNGPENSSSRTQFMKRITEFAQREKIDIILAYYPPYHSKYNPIERVWGVLENHWRGQILDSIGKAIGMAKTMAWKGKNPAVEVVEGIYKTGVKVGKKAMRYYENIWYREPDLEKWSVYIPCYEPA